MRSALARALGAFAIIAVLACTSLGTCWVQWTAADDDCCEGTANSSVKPCVDVAHTVASVDLSAPGVASAAPIVPTTFVAWRSTDFGFPIGSRVLDPPLILRL